MERNPWKLATIGMALVGTTALGTGLTTAYMLRQPADAPEVAVPAGQIVSTAGHNREERLISALMSPGR
jgi:hypothetical protein